MLPQNRLLARVFWAWWVYAPVKPDSDVYTLPIEKPISPGREQRPLNDRIDNRNRYQEAVATLISRL